MAAGCKDTLLTKMANMCSTSEVQNNDITNKCPIKVSENLHDTNTEKRHETKTNLIEEISTVKRECVIPVYTLEIMDNDARSIVMRIELPEVTSVSQCQLDITQVRTNLIRFNQ